MELKAGKCPNCGGELHLPENKNSVTCMYCDTVISVREAIDKKSHSLSGSIETWLVLARTAKNGGDNLEAIKYFNKILEVDSTNSEAWYGKAVCIYSTSTLLSIKINEAVSYMRNAVKYSNNDIALRKKAAFELYSMAMTLYNTSWNHAFQYMSVDGTGAEHGQRSSYCLEALKFAIELDDKKEYVDEASKILKAYGRFYSNSAELKILLESKKNKLSPDSDTHVGALPREYLPFLYILFILFSLGGLWEVYKGEVVMGFITILFFGGGGLLVYNKSNK